MIDDDFFEVVLDAVKRSSGGLAGLEAAVRKAAARGQDTASYARTVFYLRTTAHLIEARLSPRGQVFGRWAL